MTAVRLVVVGGSWGGLDALGRLVAPLEEECSLALAVALHRATNPPEGALVSYVQARCRLPVTEAEDKDAIEPGRLYLAPADYHLLVEPGRFALSIDAPVHYCRPSIDVLFESAADAYAEASIAVLLTGANNDGCRGMGHVKRRGGMTVVQEPGTAVRREMPDAAIASGAVDRVLPLDQITALLNELGRTR